MLDRFADALKFSAESLEVLERSASLSVKTLQRNSGLVMSTFPGEEALKKEENRKICKPIEPQRGEPGYKRQRCRGIRQLVHEGPAVGVHGDR